MFHSVNKLQIIFLGYGSDHGGETFLLILHTEVARNEGIRTVLDEVCHGQLLLIILSLLSHINLNNMVYI